MQYSTQDKVFALVWIALIPVALVLSMFLFLILCATKRKTVDTMTSSLVVSRVIHCAGAVLMAALFKLEHWKWSSTECNILMWLWITAWTSDFLTTLFFLMFYSGRIARKSPRSTCYVAALFLMSWILAIVAGGLPAVLPDIFKNFEEDICSVGLSTSDDPIPQATIPILGVGFMLLIVMIIALMAETQSKILIYWTSLKAERRRDVVEQERGNKEKTTENPEVQETAENLEKYWIQENGDAPSESKGTSEQKQDEPTSDDVDKESTPWIRSENSMKDIRNIMVAAAGFAILFDIIPQLVFFVLELGVGYRYRYTHHVLLSTGLVHAILLPATIVLVSPRYQTAYRTACCPGSAAKPCSTVKRDRSARANNHNTVAGVKPRQSLRLQVEDVDSMVSEVQQGHSVSVDIPDTTCTESSTDNEATEVKQVNGQVNPAFEVSEVQVVIESADVVRSAPPEVEEPKQDDIDGPQPVDGNPVVMVTLDPSPSQQHLSVARSHSAIVDRRAVVSDSNLTVKMKTATIRRSPSSLSQMINPPVPEPMDNAAPPTDSSSVNGQEITKEKALTLEEINAENRDRGDEMLDYEEAQNREHFGDDEESPFEDSDSELWSHLYDYDEEDIAAVLEEEGTPIEGQRLRKASIALIAAHQMRKASLVSSTGSSSSLQRRELERLRKKLAKKRRASIDAIGGKKEKEPGLKSGIAGLVQINMATHMAMLGKSTSLDEHGQDDKQVQGSMVKAEPVKQAGAIPVAPPPPPLPGSTAQSTIHVHSPPALPTTSNTNTPPPPPASAPPRIPTPPPLPPLATDLRSQSRAGGIPTPPPLPTDIKAQNISGGIPPPPPLPSNLLQQGQHQIKPHTQSKIEPTYSAPSLPPHLLLQEQLQSKLKSKTRTEAPPAQMPSASPSPPHLLQQEQPNQKVDVRYEDGVKSRESSTSQEIRSSVESAYGSYDSIQQQYTLTSDTKNLQKQDNFDASGEEQQGSERVEDPALNPVERKHSFLKDRRPSSLPPIALPDHNHSPNPFVEEMPSSTVVPIQTQNPYIPMRKIHQESRLKTLSSSNPFLHEIELGRENSPVTETSQNPFLNNSYSPSGDSILSFRSLPEDTIHTHDFSPPATAPASFHTNNPFFEAVKASEHQQVEMSQMPNQQFPPGVEKQKRSSTDDEGQSSGDKEHGSETRRKRAKKALRSAVMGASMVEFLRSRSEDNAEPV